MLRGAHQTLPRLVSIVTLCVASSMANAATTAFFDPAGFLTALPGAPQTEDFEGLGSLPIPSGATLGDLTFTYALAPGTLEVSDIHETISGTSGLGLDGLDSALLDGDSVAIALSSAVHAVGLYVVTSDAADPEEIRIDSPVGSATTGTTPVSILADGGHAYFVGLVSDSPFSSFAVVFAADGEANFTFLIDDITTAVPEPLAGVGLVLGTGTLAMLGRRRLGTRPSQVSRG